MRHQKRLLSQEMRLYTSVEPEDEGLLADMLSGLEEPVEEGSAVGGVHRDIARELPEPDTRRLPRQGFHPVRLLPVEHFLEPAAAALMVAAVVPSRRRYRQCRSKGKCE